MALYYFMAKTLFWCGSGTCIFVCGPAALMGCSTGSFWFEPSIPSGFFANFHLSQPRCSMGHKRDTFPAPYSPGSALSVGNHCFGPRAQVPPLWIKKKVPERCLSSTSDREGREDAGLVFGTVPQILGKIWNMEHKLRSMW